MAWQEFWKTVRANDIRLFIMSAEMEPAISGRTGLAFGKVATVVGRRTCRARVGGGDALAHAHVSINIKNVIYNIYTK